MGFLRFLFCGRLSFRMGFFLRLCFLVSTVSTMVSVGALNRRPQKTQLYSLSGTMSPYTGFSFPQPGLLHFKQAGLGIQRSPFTRINGERDKHIALWLEKPRAQVVEATSEQMTSETLFWIGFIPLRFVPIQEAAKIVESYLKSKQREMLHRN